MCTPGNEPRAPLRHWLYRIAHRAFLTNLRGRREYACFEEAAELAAPNEHVIRIIQCYGVSGQILV